MGFPWTQFRLSLSNFPGQYLEARRFLCFFVHNPQQKVKRTSHEALGLKSLPMHWVYTSSKISLHAAGLLSCTRQAPLSHLSGRPGFG